MILVVSLNPNGTEFVVRDITSTEIQLTEDHDLINEIFKASNGIKNGVKQLLNRITSCSIDDFLLIKSDIYTIIGTNIHLIITDLRVIQLLLDEAITQKNDEIAMGLITKYQENPSEILKIPSQFKLLPNTLNIEQSLLGEGTNSKVYSGWYGEKQVAIKAFIFNGKQFCRGFKDYLHEISNLALLSAEPSPHIVGLIGFVLKDLNFYIVMEKVSTSLENLIKFKPEELKGEANSLRREQINEGLIRGLCFIHEQGLMHINLKLSNILVTEDYYAKITDFAYSRQKDEIRYDGGTIITKAPEVLNGSRNSQEADIFSLGVVLWENAVVGLLDKSLPSYFNLIAENDISLKIKEFLKENRVYTSGISFKMELLITICWQNNPEKRPTVAKLVEFLNLTGEEIFHQLGEQIPTGLTLACKYGLIDLVEKSLSEENVNEISMEGYTPLLAACSSPYTLNKPNLFKLLLKYGARLEERTTQGETAFDLVFSKNNDQAISLLLAYLKENKHVEKPVMSKKTLQLVQTWVSDNSLESQYNSEFFESLSEIDNEVDQSNCLAIKQVNSTVNLFNTVDAIRFFPSGSSDKVYNKDHIKTVLDERLNKNRRSISDIPRAFGLRTKATELLMESIKTKEELLKLIEEIPEYTNSSGKIAEKNAVISNVYSFFQGSALDISITRCFGLRQKAMELKEARINSGL